MHEKLIAGLCTAVIVAPLCAICIFGPAVVGSIFAGTVAWFAGFDVVAIVGLTLVAAIAVYVAMRRRNGRRALSSPKTEVSDE